MNSLSRFEQETIITFNELDNIAEIETYNGRLKRKIMAIHEQRPTECPIIRDDGQGISCTVPKAWIKITAPRILSEDERQKLSERAKSNLRPKS